MACPVCGRETAKKMCPFCSKRCADLDLAKWFNGTYAVPSSDGEDDAPPDRPDDRSFGSDKRSVPPS